MESKRNFILLTAIIFLTIHIFIYLAGSESLKPQITDTSIQALSSFIEAGNCTRPLTGIERTMYYLKKGDTYSLVGRSFGEPLDYEHFERNGDRYFLKDEKIELGYYFEGEGLGFSGLASYGQESFLGILPETDPIDKLTSLLGEPDIREENSKGNNCLYWQFETAVLSAKIKDNRIMSVEYHAREGVADREKTPVEETELGQDRAEKGVTEEAVYQWTAAGSKSGRDDSFAYFHPYDDGYEESLTEDFIKYYLQTQDIRKEEPDGRVYNRKGEPLIEYYIDEQKAQYCFIVHLWGEYWVDYEAGTSKYREAIYCTTHCLREEDKIGYLLHNWDEEGRMIRERQYDLYGKRMADLSYEYREEVPFPFITDFWMLEGNHAPGDVAASGQKFCFHKERAHFNEDGTWSGLEDTDDWNDGKEYFPYKSTCIYTPDGKLEAIEEELQKEDQEKDWGWWDEDIDYSGRIAFEYDEKGILKAAEHLRSSNMHGTWDSSGNIEYDKKGRMIYNDYYVTHGGDIELFLYKEDSGHPWACFHWCSFVPGFENIYVFRSES